MYLYKGLASKVCEDYPYEIGNKKMVFRKQSENHFTKYIKSYLFFF